EHRDGAVDVRERVESLDELAHDPEHAPRVRLRESAALAGNLGEEPFVFSDRRPWRAARELRHGRPARYRRRGRGARAPGARRRAAPGSAGRTRTGPCGRTSRRSAGPGAAPAPRAHTETRYPARPAAI